MNTRNTSQAPIFTHSSSKQPLRASDTEILRDFQLLYNCSWTEASQVMASNTHPVEPARVRQRSRAGKNKKLDDLAAVLGLASYICEAEGKYKKPKVGQNEPDLHKPPEKKQLKRTKPVSKPKEPKKKPKLTPPPSNYPTPTFNNYPYFYANGYPVLLPGYPHTYPLSMSYGFPFDNLPATSGVTPPFLFYQTQHVGTMRMEGRREVKGRAALHVTIARFIRKDVERRAEEGESVASTSSNIS